MAQEPATAPFEGPEKLLEIWFAPSAATVPDAEHPEQGKTGLRKIPVAVWEEMLDIVKCKILSVIHGVHTDAYLLSESSLLVSPHRLILKTCGTTLNLLGLPRILDIAATQANMPSVYRCFYSRKSFMFPERQLGPHRDWSQEVQFLDSIFQNGAAYSVGKVNGDHWLLYLTNAASDFDPLVKEPSLRDPYPDYTIEILMTDLGCAARESFSSAPCSDAEASSHAQTLSDSLGITDIFPSHLTTLDAYSFTPCGYSSNALIRWGEDPAFVPPSPNSINGSSRTGEGYYTIHVTPEEGWSYASFECNIPLPAVRPASESTSVPDMKTLVERVVSIFKPGRLSLTLFISSEDEEDSAGDSRVDAAQKAFMDALSAKCCRAGKGTYKRTDKINYEFGGYDLAFASFELFSSVLK
ncbi:spermidine resistance protein [Stygiomarasmius scandens]|uniref:Spermidine resistance protein n=1 Tax=Marasmiellus scandens TaxID=2682957 RepID=A0ABR1KAV4_9AGAR